MNPKEQKNSGGLSALSATPAWLLAAAGLACLLFLPPPWAFALMLLLLTAAFAWLLATARSNGAKNAALCLLTLSLATLAAESCFAFQAWQNAALPAAAPALSAALPAAAPALSAGQAAAPAAAPDASLIAPGGPYMQSEDFFSTITPSSATDRAPLPRVCATSRSVTAKWPLTLSTPPCLPVGG